MLRAASLERINRNTLLLDPGIIAEVEDPRTLVVGQFEHIVVGDAEQVLAKHLAGIHFVKAIRVVRSKEFSALAGVKRRAVGRERDDEIVLAEIETLGEFD